MHRPPRSTLGAACAATLSLLAGCAATSTRAHGPAAQGQPWRNRLIDPLTAPTIFESPVIDSQVRPMAMLQSLPSDSIFGGGSVNVYAVQARFAVNERLAIIATKDGYVDLDPDAGGSENGLADIAVGVKYAVVDDPENGVLVTPGLIFEFASGDDDVFQGNGDGLIRPFVSAGWDRGELNVLGALGFNLPLDTDEESTSFDWHVQLSYEVTKKIVPLVEVNGITWTSGGDALAVDFEGGDLINLGASDADGTVVTGALGLRFLATDALSFGVGYEIPLTSRADLFDDRITLDIVIGF